MRLQDIMSRNVETVSSNDSAERAWNVMQQKQIRHLAVSDGSRIVGVVSERDLGGARGTKTRDGRAVSDLMTRHPVIVAPTTTVRQAASKMRSHSIGCVLVQDEKTGTRLAGIVTVSDLLDLIGRGLEKPPHAARDRATQNRQKETWRAPPSRRRAGTRRG